MSNRARRPSEIPEARYFSVRPVKVHPPVPEMAARKYPKNRVMCVTFVSGVLNCGACRAGRSTFPPPVPGLSAPRQGMRCGNSVRQDAHGSRVHPQPCPAPQTCATRTPVSYGSVPSPSWSPRPSYGLRMFPCTLRPVSSAGRGPVASGPARSPRSARSVRSRRLGRCAGGHPAAAPAPAMNDACTVAGTLELPVRNP